MNSYKINVQALTEQQKKDVQEAFFRLGYKWRGSGTNYQQLHSNFYFAEADGCVLYCEGKDFFFTSKDTSTHKQITYTELMTLAYGDSTMNAQKEFTKAAFTKSDLKDGMFVRLKNERIYILTQGNILNGSGWMTLESYDVDLKHDYDDNWSIVEAMELKHNSKKLGYGFSKIEEFEYNSIWKRPEQTQQQKQLAELKTAQEELLLKAKEIGDKIVALQQG